VLAWVSDGAEGTGVALVVVENDAVTTGRIGLSEAICIQCSLLAAGDSGLRSFTVIMEALLQSTVSKVQKKQYTLILVIKYIINCVILF
jgi:hypothetical protein